jgi:hypothetical protein
MGLFRARHSMAGSSCRPCRDYPSSGEDGCSASYSLMTLLSKVSRRTSECPRSSAWIAVARAYASGSFKPRPCAHGSRAPCQCHVDLDRFDSEAHEHRDRRRLSATRGAARRGTRPDRPSGRRRRRTPRPGRRAGRVPVALDQGLDAYIVAGLQPCRSQGVDRQRDLVLPRDDAHASPHHSMVKVTEESAPMGAAGIEPESDGIRSSLS